MRTRASGGCVGRSGRWRGGDTPSSPRPSRAVVACSAASAGRAGAASSTSGLRAARLVRHRATICSTDRTTMARTTACLHDLMPRSVRARGAPRPPVEDKRQIEEEAKMRGRTVSAIILGAVQQYLTLPVAARRGQARPLTRRKRGALATLVGYSREWVRTSWHHTSHQRRKG